jgi:hypothetical protein
MLLSFVVWAIPLVSEDHSDFSLSKRLNMLNHRNKVTSEKTWTVRNSYILIVQVTVLNYIYVSSQSFIHQQIHYLLILENFKIYIKTYIKIAPTSRFRLPYYC